MDGGCRIKACGLLWVKGTGNTWEAADGMAEWEARQGETYVLEFSGEEIAGREYQI
jgi:alpha-L-fucosidase 2